MTEVIRGDMEKMSLENKRKFPDFVSDRSTFFDTLKLEYDNWVKMQEIKPINVILPDGKSLSAESWKTTPFEIAKSIRLADSAVIAKVNGELWDLERPLEADCQLEILDFENEEGQQVFWHSSAHVLGEAMEGEYHGCLCYGPPIENGFYYDMFMKDRQISSNDFNELETFCKEIVKERQQFERLVVSKENLKKMFAYNEFKLRIINEKIDTPTTTVYKCGPLIDLCRGPHVRHTGLIKAISITKNSSTYWEGNSEKSRYKECTESLFQTPKSIFLSDVHYLKMTEWKHFQEEAAKRDHRKIGREHELFFFNELSPGSCFFLPKGAHIYNKLMDFIKSEYLKRGFTEVISPNVYNIKLWETSGHWEHYKDNMFSFEIEKDKYALKPMNCPGHCIMFNLRTRSWKELPIRFADFGVLHRNELSGALSGLTRVRRFCQDDAHIFCTMDQVRTEIQSCLDFLICVYDVFGFSLKLNLSTRPDKYLGNIEIWNKAEKELELALSNNKLEWVLNPGDGAFYGPKIDIQIQDALKRYHQCATIQLDFNLPERSDGSSHRPVIIHRAILGSIERMIAIITENYAGKWPFWISPNQAVVIPVSSSFENYAHEIRNYLHEIGYMVDINVDPGLTLNKKIRNSQLSHYNFILVVGEREVLNKTVNVRTRDNNLHGEKSLEQLIAQFEHLSKTKSKCSEMKF